MEKIFWLHSKDTKMNERATSYEPFIEPHYEIIGINEVNRFLELGWKVKMLSSSTMGDFGGQAYIVLQEGE